MTSSAADGNTYEVPIHLSEGIGAGQTIEIIYDPTEPTAVTHARFAERDGSYLGAIVLGVLRRRGTNAAHRPDRIGRLARRTNCHAEAGGTCECAGTQRTRAHRRAAKEPGMGDKSPKAKSRNKNQKDAQKQSAASKAQAKQSAQGQSSAGKGAGAKGGKKG